MYWTDCGLPFDCNSTCLNPDPPPDCITLCEIGCFCNEGYIFSNDSYTECILIEDCVPDPQIGGECILDDGEIGFLDCELCCWDTGLLSWLGDGWCDDMGGCWFEGPQYDCLELGYDCGDCIDAWDGNDPSGFCEGYLIICEDEGLITYPNGDCTVDISYCTENCDEEYVEDCHDENDCLLESWIGDGYPDCWPGTIWDLTCYDNDGGDCDGYTTCEMQGLITCPHGECVESLDDCSDSTECVDGYVTDCSGDGDCCWDNWIGDGWADCSDQQYGCDLTCYDCDGGDCPADDPGCVEVDDCSIPYDTNNDSVVNILDVIEVVNYILGEDDLLCPINDDGVINVLDIVIMVNIILEGNE